MTNLVTLVQQAQDALDARERELDARSQDLDRQAAELTARHQTVAQEEADLRERTQGVESREARLLNAQAEADRITQLETATRAHDSQLAELREKESTLAEINATLKQREADVATRERAVSDREESYKADLKQEFMEELNKRLSL